MAPAVVAIVMVMTSFTMTVTAQNHYNHPMEALRATDLVWLDTDWVLAFRLSGGIQQSAYDSYVKGADDDRPLARALLPPSCFQPPFLCCPHHYHSSLLGLWPSRFVDQVRLSLMKGEREVAFILFNGTGSTAMSWFSRDKILNSSWTDLTTEPQNHFSIKGHNKPRPRSYTYSRRFFIFRNYGGCPVDNGWLSVQDQKVDVCSWGNLNDSLPFPAILYSTRSTYVNFNSADVGRADALLVAVKLLPLDAAVTSCQP